MNNWLSFLAVHDVIVSRILCVKRDNRDVWSITLELFMMKGYQNVRRLVQWNQYLLNYAYIFFREIQWKTTTF